MAKNIVARLRYAAVVKRGESFDVWKWNVWKLIWVRLGNTASGFSRLSDAKYAADEVSREIVEMLENNQLPPEPFK